MKNQIKKERIECPECSFVQIGIVELTPLWASYVHTCKNCNHIIMESEWNRTNKPTTDYIYLKLIKRLNLSKFSTVNTILEAMLNIDDFSDEWHTIKEVKCSITDLSEKLFNYMKKNDYLILEK